MTSRTCPCNRAAGSSCACQLAIEPKAVQRKDEGDLFVFSSDRKGSRKNLPSGFGFVALPGLVMVAPGQPASGQWKVACFAGDAGEFNGCLAAGRYRCGGAK